eukprot:scaffold18423_cov110-Isochrysis_galbana.AAC.5
MAPLQLRLEPTEVVLATDKGAARARVDSTDESSPQQRPLWESQHPPLLPQQKAVHYNTLRALRFYSPKRLGATLSQSVKQSISLMSISSYASDLSAASLSHSCEITQSNPSPQSGMVQPVVNEMFATVHAAGSSLLGLFTSCATFDLTDSSGRGVPAESPLERSARREVEFDADIGLSTTINPIDSQYSSPG